MGMKNSLIYTNKLKVTADLLESRYLKK